MKRASLLGCLTLSLVAWGNASADDPPPESAALGRSAPAFSVRTAEGFVRQAQDFEGRSGLVLLFATHDTADEVRALEAKLVVRADRGLESLIVDIDCFASPRASQIFWTEAGVRVPVRYDDGAVARLFGVDGVPFAVYIDGDGVVRYLGGTGASRDEQHRFIGFLDDRLSGVPRDAPAIPAGGAELSFLPRCRGVDRR